MRFVCLPAFIHWPWDAPSLVTSVQTLPLSGLFFVFFSSSAFRRTSMSCLEKKECLFLVWVSNCYIAPTHEQTVYFWPSVCSVNSYATLGRAMENLPKFSFLLWIKLSFFIVSALFESIRCVESVWKPIPCLPCWLDHFKNNSTWVLCLASGDVDR